MFQAVEKEVAETEPAAKKQKSDGTEEKVEGLLTYLSYSVSRTLVLWYRLGQFILSVRFFISDKGNAGDSKKEEEKNKDETTKKDEDTRMEAAAAASAADAFEESLMCIICQEILHDCIRFI